MAPLIDSFNRRIDYVRLSLIDRCNFQCFYCRPIQSEKQYFPGHSYLNPDDIEKLFWVLGGMGVTKVKLTGGEPLLRKDLIPIIERLSQNSYLKDISLTTNGFFLEKMAVHLKKTGLHRVNVSLDTLNPHVFQKITQTSSFLNVWAGILKALEVGFKTIKLNVVLLKGINDQEINDFVELSLKYPLIIRFIELMPTQRTAHEHQTYFYSAEEALLNIQKKYSLIPDIQVWGGGPSRYYRVQDSQGLIGFISPLSQHFCDRCNRIRLTSRGELKLCLFGAQHFSLLPLIRSLDFQQQLEKVFQEYLKIKPFGHDLNHHDYGNAGNMGNVESFVSIGG